MESDKIELGKRAVACRGWRWSPGMLDLFGRRVLCVWPDDFGNKWSHIPENCVVRDADALPDLSDAATIGCLLALVREAYRDPSKLWEGHVEVRRDHRTLFFVVSFGHNASGALVEDTLATGGTEAEALVAALESAPHGIISGSKDEAAYWEKIALDEDARIFAMLDIIIEEKENK